MAVMAHTRANLVVLGGGCSGLSFTRELAQQGYAGNVVVIEPRTAYEDDRTWCFWGTTDDSHQAWSGLVSKSWPRWAFGRAGQLQQQRSLAGHAYHYIRSVDFYRHRLATLEAHATLEIWRGSAVEEVRREGDHWRVLTRCGRTVLTAAVLDTRPPEPAHLAQSRLFQCFAGVELALDSDAPDDQTVELMTDMRLVEGEFCFSYVLPLGDGRLLAEATFFARRLLPKASLEAELRRLLATRGWAGAKQLRRESAVLPMGLPRLAPDGSPMRSGYLRVGTAGGALRASSGFGFLRIQRWAEAAAATFIQTGTLLPHQDANQLLAPMDAIFLEALRAQPRLAPEVFIRLLAGVPPASFVRFMDDRPSGLDLARMISALPKGPFLRALGRLSLQRLGLT